MPAYNASKDDRLLAKFERWLQSPEGSDFMKKALEDADRLVERIQREAASREWPGIGMPRPRHPRGINAC